MAVFLLLRPEFGTVGAAYAALLTSVLCTPIYLYQLRTCLGVPTSVFLRSVVRPVLAVAVSVLLVRAVLPSYNPTLGIAMTIVWLGVGVCLTISIYAATMYAAWRIAGAPDGAERLAADFLRAQWARRVGAGAAAAENLKL
ncbi:MAG: hypothetical protein HC793_00450 [Aquincola sp.]|nr:hypothetical protein [Aquincola sp.]